MTAQQQLKLGIKQRTWKAFERADHTSRMHQIPPSALPKSKRAFIAASAYPPGLCENTLNYDGFFLWVEKLQTTVAKKMPMAFDKHIKLLYGTLSTPAKPLRKHAQMWRVFSFRGELEE